MPPPLDGLLVADFTRAVAGPFATQLLADRGARVIKIEDPGGGDESRHWGPVFADGGDSAYYLSLNRNKESVVLDLKSDLGRKAVTALISKADVVVENFRSGVAEKLGFGYEAASALNPRLIYASISGFRLDGEDWDRPGYDLIAQAMSGLMYANRTSNGEPQRVVFPLTDILSGMYLSHGILTALHDRERSGQGRRIWVSLVESLMSVMTSLTPMQLISGREPTAGQSVIPYQSFQASDGGLVIATPNERIFARFCEALDRKDWLADARFQSNVARVQNRDFVLDAIQQAISALSRSECLDRLRKADVPCGPIWTVTEANQSGQAKCFEFEHSSGATLRVPGNPIEGLGAISSGSPPELGEHTDAVLRELGLA